MAESGRPNYQEAASRLQHKRDNFDIQIGVLDKKIAALMLQIAGLTTQKEELAQQHRTLSTEQELFRNLASEVQSRKSMQEQTAEFPLIGAINASALDILWTTHDPLALARSLSDHVYSIPIPPHDGQLNTKVVESPDDEQVSPLAVIRVGTLGGTSMVLFDQGVTQEPADAIPAVLIHIGGGGMYAYNTEYGLREREGRIILVQNEAKHPTPPNLSLSYEEAAEANLATFLGEARYQAALSLLQPRQ